MAKTEASKITQARGLGSKTMGRGINSILGDDDIDELEKPSKKNISSVNASANKEFSYISIDKIDPNPDQPRKEFKPEVMAELIASIKADGVLQPILVEQKGERYLLVAGERRYRASKEVGLKEIPAVIKNNLGEEKVLELALIENIQRSDLTPIEEALAYKKIMEIEDLSQEEVAAKVGKSRAAVANSLRLLKLPAVIQEALKNDTISVGHAKVLLSVANANSQLSLFNKVVATGISVRQLEKEVAGLNAKQANSQVETQTDNSVQPLRLEPELINIQNRFMTALGTKVQIRGSVKKGKIEIDYFSSDDLDRIYELIVN